MESLGVGEVADRPSDEKARADDGSGSDGGGDPEAAGCAPKVAARPAGKAPPPKCAGDRKWPNVGHPPADPRQRPAGRPPLPQGPPPPHVRMAARLRDGPVSLGKAAKQLIDIINHRNRADQDSPRCC